MMTIGPALLALAWFEERSLRGPVSRAFVTLGRVPMFFYLLQCPLAHGLAVILGLAAGKPIAYLFVTLFGTVPPEAGFPLWVVYPCWALVIAIEYVLCRWYAGVKSRRRDWWLSYV